MPTIATFAADGAQAQDYPNHPIRPIVGLAAGKPTDVIARIVAADKSTTPGQSVGVEN